MPEPRSRRGAGALAFEVCALTNSPAPSLWRRRTLLRAPSWSHSCDPCSWAWVQQWSSRVHTRRCRCVGGGGPPVVVDHPARSARPARHASGQRWPHSAMPPPPRAPRSSSTLQAHTQATCGRRWRRCLRRCGRPTTPPPSPAGWVLRGGGGHVVSGWVVLTGWAQSRSCLASHLPGNLPCIPSPPCHPKTHASLALCLPATLPCLPQTLLPPPPQAALLPACSPAPQPPPCFPPSASLPARWASICWRLPPSQQCSKHTPATKAQR